MGTAVGRNPISFLIPCHRALRTIGRARRLSLGPAGEARHPRLGGGAGRGRGQRRSKVIGTNRPFCGQSVRHAGSFVYGRTEATKNEGRHDQTSRFLILASVGVIALAGCEPGPAGTNTKNGAITGALIGGVFGATRKGDDKLGKAATGALVGGALGGLIGNQLDRQAAELQSDIGDSRVKIVNTGSQLIVTMPEGILFATDSASVQPSIQNELYAVADNLNRYPNTRVEVVGHTDNTGSAAHNQDLSERAHPRFPRSCAVRRFGREARSYGRGETMPVASNLTPEGRAQNRRVEIVIIPTTNGA